jgi:hypothetical protein
MNSTQKSYKKKEKNIKKVALLTGQKKIFISQHQQVTLERKHYSYST